MAAKLTSSGGEQVKTNMDKAAQQVKQAAEMAAQDVAKAIVQRGRADIAAGGNFGANWTNALQAQVTDQGNKLDITVTMGGPPPVTYWKIFEYGATIKAKNPSGMLWIPFDKSNKTWPRDYSGPLFRAGNALFDARTKEPKYGGTPSVTIPQKFHLRDIVKTVAGEMKKYYSLHMR